MLLFIWSQDLLHIRTTGISESDTPLCWPLLSPMLGAASLWLGTPCTQPGHQLLLSSPQPLQGPGTDASLARDTRHSSELSQCCHTGGSTCTQWTYSGRQKQLLPADCSFLYNVLLCYQNLGYLQRKKLTASSLMLEGTTKSKHLFPGELLN